MFDTEVEEATIFCNISKYTTSRSVTTHNAQVFNYTVYPRYECYIRNPNNMKYELMGRYCKISVKIVGNVMGDESHVIHHGMGEQTQHMGDS
jgi:uncharacterized protein affecting Mg2+/Co2+ transport